MTETETSARWFIVHTYSGFEMKVKDSLQQRAEAMAKLSDLAKSLREARDAVAQRDLIPEGLLRRNPLKAAQNLALALQQKQYKQAAEELQKLKEQAELDQDLADMQLAELKEKCLRLEA